MACLSCHWNRTESWKQTPVRLDGCMHFQKVGFRSMDTDNETLQLQRAGGSSARIDVFPRGGTRKVCSASNRQSHNSGVPVQTGQIQQGTVHGSEKHLGMVSTEQCDSVSPSSTWSGQCAGRSSQQVCLKARVEHSSSSIPACGVNLGDIHCGLLCIKALSRTPTLQCAVLQQQVRRNRCHAANLDRRAKLDQSSVQNDFSRPQESSGRQVSWFQTLRNLAVCPPIRLPRRAVLPAHPQVTPERWLNHQCNLYVWLLHGRAGDGHMTGP